MNAPREFHEKRTAITVVVPASGGQDLRDPITMRTVVPMAVELELTRVETPDNVREYAHVSVHGPRRLKSGEQGKPINSLGWEAATQYGARGYVDRPAWLTELIAAHMPEVWPLSLVELPGGAA